MTAPRLRFRWDREDLCSGREGRCRRGTGRGSSLLWAKNITSLPFSPGPAPVETCDEVQLFTPNPELAKTPKASPASGSQTFRRQAELLRRTDPRGAAVTLNGASGACAVEARTLSRGAAHRPLRGGGVPAALTELPFSSHSPGPPASPSPRPASPRGHAERSVAACQDVRPLCLCLSLCLRLSLYCPCLQTQ